MELANLLKGPGYGFNVVAREDKVFLSPDETTVSAHTLSLLKNFCKAWSVLVNKISN
jgi:hypothetical protein